MMDSVVRIGVLLAVICCLAECLPLVDFIPFGPNNGDELLEASDNASATVALQMPIAFYGMDRNYVTVRTDGQLDLMESDQSSTFASVLAFAADVDTRVLGKVLYREITDPDLLEEIENVTLSNLLQNPILSVFVATWFYVGHYDSNSERANTFQCFLTTDGTNTIAALLYADGMIQWTTGDRDGGVNGTGGDPADVGFIGDNGSNPFFLPASNTSDLVDLDTTSNVGIPGQWVFQVDEITISSPIDPDGSVITDVSGSGSGIGSGSGSPQPGSCVAEHYTSCCEVTAAEVCSPGATISCFCDQPCFQRGDCCSDILEVPCLPDLIDIGFVLTTYTVMEGQPYAVVEVEASGFPENISVVIEVHVLLYTSDGTAKAPNDYTGTIEIITFTQDEVQPIRISILNDNLVEDTEFFSAHLTTTQDNLIRLGDATASISILDNDNVTVTLDMEEYTVSEDEGFLEVTVSINGTLERSVEVVIATSPNTASSLGDYVSLFETLTFMVSPDSRVVQITVEDDDRVEDTESFGVLLDSSDPAVLLPRPFSPITLLDSSEGDAEINFQQVTYFVDESGDPCIVVVCVVLTLGTLDRNVLVTVTTADVTAQAPGDYMSLTTDITFTPSSNSTMCVDIQVFQDEVVEDQEEFTVTLSSNDLAVNFTTISTASIFISDNDTVTVTLDMEEYTVSEDEGFLEVTVNINGTLERSVEVVIATSPNTASSPDDYVFLNETLTFMVSPDSRVVQITVEDDDRVEDTELFGVQLESSDPAVFLPRPFSPITLLDVEGSAVSGSGVSGSASGSRMPGSCVDEGFTSCCLTAINNDCSAETSTGSTCFCDRLCHQLDDCCFDIFEVPCLPELIDIGFVLTTYTVMEGQPYAVVEVEASGFPENISVVIEVNVMLYTSDDTAEVNNDYTGRMLILNFTQDEVQSIHIPILDDNLVEDTEFFFVNLTTTQDDLIHLGNTTASVSILDNDTVSVDLDQASYTIAEADGGLEVCVSTNTSLLERNITVTLSTDNGTAFAPGDYMPVNTVLTFYPGSGDMCVTITVFEDGSVEDPETFIVSLTSDDPGATPAPPAMGVVEITDSSDAEINLQQDTYSVPELDGSVEVCVVLSSVLERNVSITLTTADATAQAPGDYMSLTTDITFTPTSNSTMCVDIQVFQDGVVEDQEEFTVTLSSNDMAVNFTTISTASIFIIDNDTVTVTLDMEEYTVSEDDGFLEVTVNINGTLERSVEVVIATSPNTASSPGDYVSLFETLTFMVSPDSRVVQITVEDDDICEDTESFGVLLDSSDPAVLLPRPFSPITLLDSSDLVINLQQDTYSVAESDGSVEVCVDLSCVLDRNVSITFTTADATAQAPGDYMSLTTDITFTPSSNTTMCVDIQVSQDGVVEDQEEFTVTLSSNDLAVNFTTISTASIFISDNDIVNVSFSESMYNVTEGEEFVEVCIDISGQRERNVTAMIETLNGTALAPEDFISLSQELAFTPSDAQLCVNIPIVDDNIVEALEEYFFVVLSSADLGVAVTEPSNVTVVIFEEPLLNCTIGFNQSTYTVREDDDNRPLFCIVLMINGTLQDAAAVMFATMDGTAIEMDDYVRQLTPITFPPGSASGTERCLGVTRLNDDIPEPEEHFSIHLSSSTCMLDPAWATVTIVDDDPLDEIGFEMDNYTASEDDSYVEVCVVVFSGAALRDFTANISTQDDSATEVMDYTQLTQTLTFAVGDTRQCFNISITDDDTDEPVEMFFVNLMSNEANVTVPQATVSILDNDPPDIGFEPASYIVGENDSYVEVCVVVLGGSTIESFTATVSTADGSATDAMDYTALTQTLTFAVGDMRQCVNISITSDNTDEPAEMFFVNLMSTEADVIVPQATVSILDNDPPEIGFDPQFYSVSESDSYVEVCVVVFNGPTIESFTATVSTEDGSATDAMDYTPLTQTLTFAVGDMRQCFNISITDDDTDEPVEIFFVNLMSTEADVTVPQATVSIMDNDPPEIGFDPAFYSVSESDSYVEVCVVVLSGSTIESFTATVSTEDGSATDAMDYTPLTQTLTFAAGDIRQCVNISITDDDTDEPVEMFFVNLMSSEADVTVPQATVSIMDNDPPEIGFDPQFYSVSESDSYVEVCVEVLSGSTIESFTATVSTADGSATGAMDYTALTQTLTFAVGDTRQCFNISITDDDTDEPVEMFFVNLMSNEADVTVPQATVSIMDNDPPDIGFEPASYIVGENDSYVEVCVEVFSGSTIESFTSTVSTADGSATDAMDYTPLTQTLTFAVGDMRQCVNISITSDDTDEPIEMFFVNLMSTEADVTVPQATVSILDNDPPEIGFDPQFYSVSESDSYVEVCVVVFNGPTIESFTATVSTEDGSATDAMDYTPLTQTLTFAVGDMRQCFNISITDDDTDEPVEMFFVNLMSTEADVTVPQATVSIMDNDPPEIGFEPAFYSVSESDSYVEVCVVVLSGSTIESFTATVSTADGSATDAMDYTPLTQTLTFAVGDMRQCVNISITDDDIDEPVEMFFVNLMSTEADVTVPQATVSILDNDPPEIGFDPEVYTVSESDSYVEVCVVVFSGSTIESFTATVSTEDGSATDAMDYTPLTQTLTFAAGDMRQCFNISITDDDTDEPVEMFFVNLMSTEADVTVPQATVSILDNDPPEIGFDPQFYSVSESDSYVEVCVVVLSGSTIESFTATVSTEDGSATDVMDYTALTQTLTFAVGDMRQCFNISITSDNTDEPIEMFFVNLMSAEANVIVPRANVTVRDIDPPEIGFDPQFYSVSESDSYVGVCVVVLSGSTIESFTATVSTADGSATDAMDYTPLTQTLTFAAGDMRQCVNISITDDDIDEPVEMFFVNLMSTEADVTVPQATVSILDNDPPEIGFVPQFYSVSESDSYVEVCVVVLSGSTIESFTATVSTEDGSATDAMDYTELTQTLTFAVGDMRQCFNISITDDDIDEPVEMFFVNLMSTEADVTVPQATVSILDNDPPEIGFDPASYSVSESDSYVEVCVVVLSGSTIESFTATVSTEDGSATDAMDYTPLTQTLTFAVGDMRQCFNISITDDDTDEPVEMFFVNLMSTEADVTVPQATVSIMDNDPPEIGFDPEVYSVVENASYVEVCVEVFSGPTIESFTATVYTENGSATDVMDYTPLTQTLTFVVGDIRQCVNISITSDDVSEINEIFFVNLMSTEADVIVPRANITIVNDDGVLVITLLEDQFIFSERVGRATICVDLMGDTAQGLEIIVSFTTVNGTASSDSMTGDYVSKMSQIKYDSALEEVLICERVTIIDDNEPEGLETFTVQLELVTTGINVIFVFQSAAVTIVDDDNSTVVVGFTASEFQVTEDDDDDVEICVFVSGDVTVSFSVLLFADSGTAVAGTDFEEFFGFIESVTFTPGGDIVECESIEIIGDLLIEDDETFTVRLEPDVVPPSIIISPNSAAVTILDDDRRDFQPPQGAIRLINDTPTVMRDSVDFASIRVDFSLQPDVATATCELLDLEDGVILPETDCTEGTFTFTGLDANRDSPVVIIIVANNSDGDTLETITRRVRLGLNNDCAVVYVNGVEQTDVFRSIVFIEWSEIGPVESTDCRLDEEDFIPCSSPYQRNGLPSGLHALKVRPIGDNCRRRIRRTVQFIVE